MSKFALKYLNPTKNIKKLFGITLLIAFFYGSVIYPLQLLYDLEREARIDGKELLSSSICTADAEEMVFKFPVNLPYISNWEVPVEASGWVEFEGSFYSIISKNFSSDTLYVHCVINKKARSAFDKMARYSLEVGNHKKDSGSRTPSGFLKLFKKDYITTANFSFSASDKMAIDVTYLIGYTPNLYISPNLSRFTPPPQI